MDRKKNYEERFSKREGDKKEREEVKKIKEEIKNLDSLSHLQPEKFALENGIAHLIVRNMGDMKFTQLRKFFGHIKKIESTSIKGKTDTDPVNKSDIYLLMPELAYGVGRKVITRDFYEIMKICITEKIKNVKDFRRFVELLSAVIAYYKLEKA